ncbi:MAG: hypothetical protein CMJ83_04685 [Planctomycetes bacterium]|nr:hypothetical protein [Planctomycetota bacterium]
MQKLVNGLLLLCLVCGMISAQQPNTGTATMRVNGVFGPAYPITNVQMPRGLDQNLFIQGIPNAPFSTWASLGLFPAGAQTAFGILDIDILTFGVELLSGVTTASGTYILNIPLPATTPIGASAAVQTILADPTSASGGTLTAASGLVVVQGLTVTPITFTGSEPGLFGTLFNYPSGMTFPFYDATFTRMYVNSDGHCSFSGNNGDFTPTPTEFRTGPSRVAPFWTDMNPSYGGSVTVTVDQSPLTPFPTVTVDWVNMAEWSNTGSQHTFQLVLNMLTGDITVNHSPFNGAMIYDQLMGLTPGQSKLPPPPNNQWSAQKNLSALPITPIVGLPNEAFWEWYGIPGAQMPFYTGPPNPWDMAGSSTSFLCLNNIGNPGSNGTYYYGT